MDAGVGAGEEIVVDVGDVADAVGFEATVDQPPLEDVEDQEGGRVPDVGGVVRGDPADVHRHPSSCRREVDDGAAGRVVQAQWPVRHPWGTRGAR